MSGRTRSEMVEDLKYSLMAQNILVNTSTIDPTAKVCSRGQMGKSMMVNGLRERSMDLAFGRGFRATLMWVNGEKAKSKATVSISGKMATNTKASGKIA